MVKLAATHVRFDLHLRAYYTASIIISAFVVRILFPVHAARIDIDSLCQGARG
jgi:hypothetical protein